MMSLNLNLINVLEKTASGSEFNMRQKSYQDNF
jgi:hypothetical protein